MMNTNQLLTNALAHQKRPVSIKNEQGAALIYLISVILIMSVLGAAMLNLISTSTLGQVSGNHVDQAYFMAEAGARYALGLVKDDIESDGAYDDTHAIHNQTFVLDHDSTHEEGRFKILVDNTDPKFTLITAIGTINVGVSTDVEAKIIYSMVKTVLKKGKVVLSDPVQYFSLSKT